MIKLNNLKKNLMKLNKYQKHAEKNIENFIMKILNLKEKKISEILK